MKKALLTVILITTSNLFAQLSEPTHDLRLVGTWNGSEKDQQQMGLEKHWVMHRSADGTFILLFTAVRDGEVSSHAEKGKWWVENNEFHELHFESGVTDIYVHHFRRLSRQVQK